MTAMSGSMTWDMQSLPPGRGKPSVKPPRETTFPTSRPSASCSATGRRNATGSTVSSSAAGMRYCGPGSGTTSKPALLTASALPAGAGRPAHRELKRQHSSVCWLPVPDQQAHSLHVADLADRLFTGLLTLHNLKNRDRTLLRYAAIIHDIGWAGGRQRPPGPWCGPHPRGKRAFGEHKRAGHDRAYRRTPWRPGRGPAQGVLPAPPAGGQKARSSPCRAAPDRRLVSIIPTTAALRISAAPSARLKSSANQPEPAIPDPAGNGQ